MRMHTTTKTLNVNATSPAARRAGASLFLAALAAPEAALAAVDAQATFNSFMATLATAIHIIGGGMVIFGLVSLGMNLFGTASGNGASLGSAIGWMVGGVLIFVAGSIAATLTF